jgi:hypothetical protein
MENKKEKNIEETEEIQEMSAMGAGGVQIGATKAGKDDDEEKEDKLRSMIREVLKLYSTRKENLRIQSVFEGKLRETIRNLLVEKESKEAAPESTLVGILRSLLNNIVPQIRLDYIKLQTNDEERAGFKDYFYNAVNKIIEITNEKGQDTEVPQELEEEETIKIKSDKPGFIGDVNDGTEEDKPEKEASVDGESTKDISSYYERGQNFGESAFNAIKDRIQNVVAAQIVPEEYQQFVKALNDNLEAWFEIWDKNAVKSQEPAPSAETETPPAEDFDIENLEESEIDFD